MVHTVAEEPRLQTDALPAPAGCAAPVSTCSSARGDDPTRSPFTHAKLE